MACRYWSSLSAQKKHRLGHNGRGPTTSIPWLGSSATDSTSLPMVLVPPWQHKEWFLYYLQWFTEKPFKMPRVPQARQKGDGQWRRLRLKSTDHPLLTAFISRTWKNKVLVSICIHKAFEIRTVNVKTEGLNPHFISSTAQFGHQLNLQYIFIKCCKSAKY